MNNIDNYQPNTERTKTKIDNIADSIYNDLYITSEIQIYMIQKNNEEPSEAVSYVLSV